MACTMHGHHIHTELSKSMLISWVSDICLVQISHDHVNTVFCNFRTYSGLAPLYNNEQTSLEADKLTIQSIENFRNRFHPGTTTLRHLRSKIGENCRGACFDVGQATEREGENEVPCSVRKMEKLHLLTEKTP